MTNAAATTSREAGPTDARRTIPALHPALARPEPSPRFGVRLSPAGASLWRVINRSGHVIGHLQHVDHALGARWAARRYRAGVGGFRTIGEFWSVDDAVSALRAA